MPSSLGETLDDEPWEGILSTGDSLVPRKAESVRLTGLWDASVITDNADSLPAWSISLGAGLWLCALDRPLSTLLMPLGSGGACARCSLSFLRYRSLSLSALSRSLFKPMIMARCFSTRRHSWALWAAADCLSFQSAANALSVEPPNEARNEAKSCSCGFCCSTGGCRLDVWSSEGRTELDGVDRWSAPDDTDMDESIDGFRANAVGCEGLVFVCGGIIAMVGVSGGETLAADGVGLSRGADVLRAPCPYEYVGAAAAAAVVVVVADVTGPLVLLARVSFAEEAVVVVEPVEAEGLGMVPAESDARKACNRSRGERGDSSEAA